MLSNSWQEQVRGLQVQEGSWRRGQWKARGFGLGRLAVHPHAWETPAATLGGWEEIIVEEQYSCPGSICGGLEGAGQLAYVYLCEWF